MSPSPEIGTGSTIVGQRSELSIMPSPSLSSVRQRSRYTNFGESTGIFPPPTKSLLLKTIDFGFKYSVNAGSNKVAGETSVSVQSIAEGDKDIFKGKSPPMFLILLP